MTEAESRRDDSPAESSPKEDTRISDAINKLMANPELIGMIGRAMASAKAESPPSAEAAEPPVAAAETERSEASPAAADMSKVISTIAPMLSSLSGISLQKSAETDHRSCLLRALKPYLSKERGEAIEQMITVGRISEIIRGANQGR